VVEQSSHHPKVETSRPAATDGTRKDNGKKWFKEMANFNINFVKFNLFKYFISEK
jgi:hypothetical protein